ncbi:hypothetical protein P152DRAFT_220188 [Eremomyces bilateralis CBS 781.70]|uniref:Cora-domain-containing protein n=1 Tax=Eremomyces bilateralis CBS 781.70 TaxID=1392243 RepID=A0A6G1FRW3_9PEZI|nr:uncharacterized protein P152DRAFT_220188 [Eremomyces bilateralis CBS 781.70]KAF1808412.1 hypothetical protein P152DRAFT_220188 [Eremomyces bilateralis CBS 781.70]
METLITKNFIEAGARELDDFKALAKCFGQEHRGPMVHAHFMRHSCTRVSTHSRPDIKSKQHSLPAEEAGDKTKQQENVAENVPKDGTSTPKLEPSRGKEKEKDKEKEKGKELPTTRAEKKKAKTEKQTKKGGKGDGNGGKGQKPGKGQDKTALGTPTPGKGKGKTGKLVLFMPYLHYETDSRRMRMSQTIKEALTREPPFVPQTLDDLLIRAYINSDPPLHTRRTLDQFFYHGIDTTERDRDQVVFRYCQHRGLEPKLFMVDQMWMWILGEELIITSFPQRYQQPKQDPVNMLEGIIEDMNVKTRPPMKNVYDLAMLITTRCSGVFDRHRLDNQEFQFLDMFETSIGHVTNRESKLFSRFNRASAGAAQWLRNHRRSQRASTWSRALDTNPNDPGRRDDLFQDSLLDIGTETELLAEIKDIRDEINIIKMVLQHQVSVLPDLADFMFEELGGKKSLEAFEIRKRSKDQLKIIDVHVKDLERMDKQAENIYTSLTHLLDLKQKQANAFEARFAADRAISSARQGQTVMVFTIVTIIFLPMSFIASFFTVDISNFPRNDDGSSAMTLDWVSKYVFGIGFAISIPLIMMAFTVDDIGRAIKHVYHFLAHFHVQLHSHEHHHQVLAGHGPRRSVHFEIDSHRDSISGFKEFPRPDTSELRRSVGFGSDHGVGSDRRESLSPLKNRPLPRVATGRTGFSWKSWEAAARHSRDIERG